MTNEFTAIYEQDGDWMIGYCPEVPGANGQGRTKEDCRESLAAAMRLFSRISERTGFEVSPAMPKLRR